MQPSKLTRAMRKDCLCWHRLPFSRGSTWLKTSLKLTKEKILNLSLIEIMERFRIFSFVNFNEVFSQVLPLLNGNRCQHRQSFLIALVNLLGCIAYGKDVFETVYAIKLIYLKTIAFGN